LIGARRAGELIAGGRWLSPQAMQAEGLIDALADTHDARIAAALDLMQGCNPRQIWDRPGHAPADTQRADLPEDARPGALAPAHALDAIDRIVTLPFEDGAEVESAAFAEAACSVQAGALVGLNFLDRNVLRRRPDAEVRIAALTSQLRGPGDMGATALSMIARGIAGSAALLNAASIRAGLSEVTGGIVRMLAAQGRIAPQDLIALQDADQPEHTTGTHA
jgi:hypothetical protein